MQGSKCFEGCVGCHLLSLVGDFFLLVFQSTYLDLKTRLGCCYSSTCGCLLYSRSFAESKERKILLWRCHSAGTHALPRLMPFCEAQDRSYYQGYPWVYHLHKYIFSFPRFGTRAPLGTQTCVALVRNRRFRTFSQLEFET